MYFDIVDFIGRDTVEEEVVAGKHEGKQIVVKSGVNPKLESVTLSQWSIVNLAIMYKLMREGRLVDGLHDKDLPTLRKRVSLFI